MQLGADKADRCNADVWGIEGGRDERGVMIEGYKLNMGLNAKLLFIQSHLMTLN